MKDTWAKAKENKEILHFKNFQEPEISWEDALNFVYQLFTNYYPPSHYSYIKMEHCNENVKCF